MTRHLASRDLKLGGHVRNASNPPQRAEEISVSLLNEHASRQEHLSRALSTCQSFSTPPQARDVMRGGEEGRASSASVSPRSSSAYEARGEWEIDQRL